MTSELSHVFARPEGGPAAAGAFSPRDRISLRDYMREVEIGAFQEERGVEQRLLFNVVVDVGHAAAPLADDVDRILSYDAIVGAVDESLAEERLSLLETLAEKIAERLLQEPRARRVFVRIEKLDRGPFALGVEIERARLGAPAGEIAEDAFGRPLFLYLSNQAIADPRLPVWLNQMEALERPLVLTVGHPDLPPPKARAAMPRERIRLLALEQNAWVLASRDRRCIVVDSRTEILHAVRAGRIVVWAPAKIVLDAVDGPETGPENPAALAAWFAGKLRADRLIGLDADVPGGVTIPLSDRLDL